METTRVSKLTKQDIGQTFQTRGKKILIIDTFQSLFIGKDTITGTEYPFYNTGECTRIECGWLERIKVR